MKKQSQTGSLLLMGLVMAAAALFELSPHEPAYQGKRLSELLKEKSFSAITGLAQIGPDAVLPLVQCLTNETPYLRSAAMISLSMIKPENETALRAVVERLDDRDNRVRATAANALRSFWNKPELVVPPLIKSLSDSDGTVRVQAAMTLGHLGAQAQTAIPALAKALEDENQSVRHAAVSALREIDTGGQLGGTVK